MKNRPNGQKMAILTDIHMKESNGCSRNLNMNEKNRTQICAFFFFNFIFKLYTIVLVLPTIEMNPPQVYLCSLS